MKSLREKVRDLQMSSTVYTMYKWVLTGKSDPKFAGCAIYKMSIVNRAAASCCHGNWKGHNVNETLGYNAHIAFH